MATLGELAGQEPVTGHETGQEREPVEAGVAAGVQDHERRQLHHVKQEVTAPARAEDDLSFLGDDRGRPGDEGSSVRPAGQEGDP